MVCFYKNMFDHFNPFQFHFTRGVHFSWRIPVSIAVFVTSIVAMTVSVLATGEAVSVAAHCSEEIKNIHKVHKVHIGGFSSTGW